MIRAPTDPAARAATTSRRLDARLDDAQIIAHAKSSNAAPLDANTRKFPRGFPVGFSRLGFRAYPITPRPRRDRRFARVHVARAPLSRVAIDAMKNIEAIDRDRVGDARADAREHDDDRPSGRRMRRDRTRRGRAREGTGSCERWWNTMKMDAREGIGCDGEWRVRRRRRRNGDLPSFKPSCATGSERRLDGDS